MPKDRIEDIPAKDADADDRSDQDLPAELKEILEPPSERQDVSQEELEKLSKKR
jgi:hypothetical protein